MKSLHRDILASIDGDFLMRHTAELTMIELGQTFTHYHRSVDYVFSLMKECNIPNVEKLMFPADGKTVYQDKKMPLAWDASRGKLTILSPLPDFNTKNTTSIQEHKEETVADYGKNPLHLVKGSISTPPEGMKVRIITEAQAFSGEDVRGAMVMLDSMTSPRKKVLTPLLDLGALGFISDFLPLRHITPDRIHWVNACSESSWHVNEETRAFIGFSITPRNGERIRYAASHGTIHAIVECDGHRYKGKLPAVTALIPGKRKKEFWIMAHLFEPFANDNSAGVIAGIETAKRILQQGALEYSVRLIFTMELYGFAAYAALRGNSLRDVVVGACNIDSLPCFKGDWTHIDLAGAGSPFYGNAIAKTLINELAPEYQNEKTEYSEVGKYHDDMFLSDVTTGVPTIWCCGVNKYKFWHNSIQNIEHLEEATFIRGTAFVASLVSLIASPQKSHLRKAFSLAIKDLRNIYCKIKNSSFGSDCERMEHLCNREIECIADFRRVLPVNRITAYLADLKKCKKKLSAGLEDSIPHSLYRDYAEGIIPKRLEVGLPCDLAKVPIPQRISLPNAVIYGHFANILANMDGKKNLAKIIREAEYECYEELTEKMVKKCIDAVCFLADYGYLKMTNHNEITSGDIVNALISLGIADDDVLLIHSSVSSCGHIVGGAEAIIESCKKISGTNGAVLFPTFTYPYLILGNRQNKSYNYRPFDSSDPEQIWVGEVPKMLLRKYPHVLRSKHITHSWAGFGIKAQPCLEAHGATEPPANENSPMAKALVLGGKILYFGCGFETTTFIHYLENKFNMKYLDSAVCAVKNGNGTLKKVLIENHLPGDRNFYHDGENCKFFARAKATGLEIKRARLGIGELKLIDIRQMFEIGCMLIKEDIDIFVS